MIRCVVGLGNPGEEYALTRHNIGFRVVDRVAEGQGARWRKGWWKNYWEAEVRALELVLCKPATYMNRSGEAVAALCARRGFEAEEVLVVYDDVDLPLGRLRARLRGSSGGHKGMQSILDHLKTEAVPRLRVGIGASEGDCVEYVLSRFRVEEERTVGEVVTAAAEAVVVLATLPWEQAQARVNAWRPGQQLFRK